MSRVRIGTVGWDFPAWSQAYYPEDIPEDWKLAFYANEFTAVALPENTWKGKDLGFLEESMKDLDEDFGVYCLVQSGWPTAREVAAARQVVNDYLKGFVIEEAVLAGKRQVMQLNDAIYPAKTDESVLPKSRYWAKLASATDKPISVIRLHDRIALKTLRQQFEYMQPQLDQHDDILVLVTAQQTGDAPDVEFLQQLRTLLELMAIA